MRRRKQYFHIHLIVIFLAIFLSGCVVQKNPVTGKKRAYAYSWSQERQIGENADKQIQQEYGVYDDPKLQEYVSRIGQKVLSESHLRRKDTPEKFKETPFTFRILNSPVVNAFALPGGFVYVTRGLLSHLENEAQLAVVLGHEIGHVAARHASQQALQQKIGQAALIGGAVVGQEVFGVSGQDILNLGSSAAQLLFLRYSRDDEREADQLGVEYAAMSGYQAASASHFFTSLKRLSDKSGQNLPSLLSTHPDPGNREKTIVKLADQWKQKGYDQKVIDKQAFMNEINNIIYGDNPREGLTQNGYFFHPDLKFKFPVPDKWQVINQASQVVFVSPKQDAIMIMSIDSQSENPRQSVMNVINQNGIQVLETGSAKSGDITAYKATATAQTQNNKTIKLFIYALDFNNNIYRFTDYSALENFPDFQPDFINTARGFSKITDSKILNIKPVRLHVVKTQKSAPFKSFLPSKLPMNLKPDDIAIINQVSLNENISSGNDLKIPEQ